MTPAISDIPSPIEQRKEGETRVLAPAALRPVSPLDGGHGSVRQQAREAMGEQAGTIRSPRPSHHPLFSFAPELSGVREYAHVLKRTLGKKTDHIRATLLPYIPSVITQHPTTFISIMQVSAEIALLKASGIRFFQNTRGLEKGVQLTEEELAARPVNYLLDPPHNLWRGIKGEHKELHKQNVWSARSTMAGFTGWTIGAITPDPKHPEVSQEAADHPEDSMLRHGVRQVYHGLHLFDPQYRREVTGLGNFAAGLLSLAGSCTNVNVKTGARFCNPTQLIGAGITAFSAGQLLFERDDKKAWHDFGTTIWLRTPFFLTSIWNKYQGGDRWGWYAAGNGLFQGSAVVSFLAGGGEGKSPAVAHPAASESPAGLPKPTEHHHASLPMYGKAVDQAAGNLNVALPPIPPSLHISAAEHGGQAFPHAVKEHKTAAVA